MIVCLDTNIVIYLVETDSIAVSRATWEHAAQIGATFNFKALDSLHLATAIEHGCGLFLTADSRLARCTAIPVEVLT